MLRCVASVNGSCKMPMRALAIAKPITLHVHFGNATQTTGMHMYNTLKEVKQRVAALWSLETTKIAIRYKDEDGDLVTLADQEDLAAMMTTASEYHLYCSTE